MTPPMSPQIVSEHGCYYLKLNDIYRYTDWGIDLTRGSKLHSHGQNDFGVYHHYFGIGIKPILICSYCEERIPNSILDVLLSAYKLWNLRAY